MKTKTESVNFFRQVWHVIRALFDKRTPLGPKILGLLIIAYVIIPFDLFPDAPIIGWVDDATLSILGMFIISKLVPNQVLEEYKAEGLKVEGGGRKENKDQ
jgi:uncharacterized membrane protein YkvA (DUF1232 family)